MHMLWFMAKHMKPNEEEYCVMMEGTLYNKGKNSNKLVQIK